MQLLRGVTAFRHRSRLLVLGLLLALVTALVAGCSEDSKGKDSKGKETSAGGDREAAETYLRDATDQLDKVLSDYRSGKKDEAHDLAEQIGHDYEGVPEKTVAKAAPDINRQLDSLIEASLPGAIDKGEPESQIATLVEKAKGLMTQALEEIESSE